jgi:S1-C subfamily serine protease
MSTIDNLRLQEGGNKPAPNKTGTKKVEAEAIPLPEPPQAQMQIPQHDSSLDEKNVMSTAKSIVKLYVSSNAPDAGQPYSLQRAQPSTSSGFFVEYHGKKYILTNAHCVQYFTFVQVKKYGSSRKYQAQVLYIADTCDLAVLTVNDPIFWRRTAMLKLGVPPQVNTTVYVCGYPTGGEELSVTSGVVSRFGVTAYSHSTDSYLSIQVTSPINSGNSGGPALGLDEDGEFIVVGVAFQALMGANSVGYLIPTTVVDNMLESFRTNNPGCPSLNIITQSIESETQRDSLFIPPLAGLIDYLYDLSQIQSTLLDLMEDSGIDVKAASAAVEGHAEDSKGVDDVILPTPESGIEHDQEGDEDNEDNEEDAQHFIIGQDDEYDYVIFKKQTPVLNDDEFGDEIEDEDDEEDEDGEDGEDDGLDNIEESPTPKAKAPKKSPISIQNSPKGTPAQPDGTVDLVLGDEENPVYRIKRTSDVRPPPPVDLLPLLLSENGLFETQIGVCVRNIIPFTASADLFQVNDVLLAIDSVPISCDETVLFRENERVRYNFLTTNRQIGDTCSVLLLRGFDILTIQVPIQKKVTVAPIFTYRVPEWMVALGLLFIPLSGHLLEAEFGEEWTSQSPVTLLTALFMGSLYRFHQDEEIIILTQVLAHNVTEGYDQQMERLTHVNGERVINMSHLSKILNQCVVDYESNKAKLQELKSKSPLLKSPRDIAKSPIISPTPEDNKHDTQQVEEVLEPAEFQKLFAEQIQTVAKLNYITFTVETGQVITLSLADGHKHQVEILKLHQIPLPGCSDSLTPMYDMKVDVTFTNENLAQKSIQEVLSQPILSQSKSSRSNTKDKDSSKQTTLPIIPLSPRNSLLTPPHEQKLKRESSLGNKQIVAELEKQRELTRSQFVSDFTPKSPQETMKSPQEAFKKYQEDKMGAKKSKQ